jgi:peptidoglycan hydrolase-like protein with peptidoglycan-binding domain
MIGQLVRVPEPAPVVPPTPVAQKDPVLRVGSSGPEVAQVQTWLFADGLFGVGTFDAVRAFQKKHGLSADGVIGPRTWAKLREVFE